MINFAFQPFGNARAGHPAESSSDNQPESLLAFVSNASMQIKNLINLEVNVAERDTASLYSTIPSPNPSYCSSVPSPTSWDDQEVPSLSPKPASRKMNHRPAKTRRHVTSRNYPYLSPASPSFATSYGPVTTFPKERVTYSPNSASCTYMPNMDNPFISVRNVEYNGSFYQDTVKAQKDREVASYRNDHVSKETTCARKETGSTYYPTTISPCPDLEDLLDFMLAEDCMSPDFFLHSLMAK